MISQRLAGVPMETNGILAVPADGALTCWVSHQAPHSIHGAYAPALGLEPDQLRIVCPWVGGGFGPKAAPYVEHLVAAAAALALGRPVKWAEGRSEDMVSLVHGRDYVMTAKLGLSADGKIVGLDGSVVASAGAYPGVGAVLPMLTQMMSVGVYDIPAVRFQATSLVTNNTTIGAYRGAGRPEATQLIERVLDVAADQLGMDPAEIRRVNFLQPSQFPLTTPTGGGYDSGEYEKVARRRAAGLRLRGAAGRTGPPAHQRPHQAARHRAVDLRGSDRSDRAARRVRCRRDQRRRVRHRLRGNECARPRASHRLRHAGQRCARHPDGQDLLRQLGHRTACPAARAPWARVRFRQPAARSTWPPTEVLERARRIAGHLLEAPAEDMVVGEGGIHVAGVPSKSVSWVELAAASKDASKLPDGLEPATLRHELDFDGTNSTFPFGAHVSVVEVDMETGGVTMLRHVAVDDCGRILNPLLVAGQQHGGIAQGAAQALYEWVQYDEDGNPVTSNLMDYAIPSAAELCSFEVSNTQTDSPRNPLGAKGIGESGTIGSTPAIQNAVIDALSHLGVTHLDMPCTAERVWRAIQAVA